MMKQICDTCELNPNTSLKKLGEATAEAGYTVALAGNPNTGISTVFNALTGIHDVSLKLRG